MRGRVSSIVEYRTCIKSLVEAVSSTSEGRVSSSKYRGVQDESYQVSGGQESIYQVSGVPGVNYIKSRSPQNRYSAVQKTCKI